VNLIASAATLDNGVLTVGKTSNAKGLIVKLDSNGNTVWSKNITKKQIAFNTIEFQQIISTKDSNFLVIGNAKLSTSGKKIGVCMKLNQNGDSIWSKYVSMPNYDLYFNDVIETFNNNYIVLGYEDSSIINNTYFLNLNQNGNLITSKIFKNNLSIKANTIKQCKDSGFVIAGSSIHFGYLMKISKAENLIWTREYTIPLPTSPTNKFSITGLEVVGDYYYFNARWGSSLYPLVKTDTSGQTITLYGGDYIVSKPFKTSDNHLIFSYSEPIPPLNINYKYGLIKIDTNANVVWKKETNFSASSISKTPSNELLLCELNDVYTVNFYFYYKKSTIVRSDETFSNLNCVQNVNSNVFGNNPQLIQNFIITSSQTSTISGIINDFYPSYTSLVLNNSSKCVTSNITEKLSSINNVIYPNPSTGIFSIASENYQSSQLIIYNNLSQIILVKEFLNTKTNIDLQNQPKGIYHYQIKSKYYDTTYGKLILE
jgi:hypothetical protein